MEAKFSRGREKILWVCYRGVCCFILFVRLHILPEVSCENDQSSIKLKSKLIVSIADGSGKYKLIECKDDSSVACTFNIFIFFFFSFLFWLLVKNSTKFIGEKKKPRKFQPKQVPESTSNENKHYMICTTTTLMYNVLQIRVAKCLCSISSKVVLKEGMMLNLSNL